MNLSLTPLNEAYSTLKVKPKLKENMYSNSEYQKEVLKQANAETSVQVPHGWSETTQTTNMEIVQPSSTSNKIAQSIKLEITDPELIELLKPYKEEFMPVVLKNKMIQQEHSVEFFKGSDFELSNYDIKLLLIIMIGLLIIDMGIRIKYRL